MIIPKPNHRYLFKEECRKYYSEVYECLVMEVSPSKDYIKIKRLDGYIEWARLDMLFFVEELGVVETKEDYKDTASYFPVYKQ